MDNVNILIADNQPFTRIGITSILDTYLDHHVTIESVKNKNDLFTNLELKQYHLLIIDFDLFDLDIDSELTTISKKTPSIGILAVTDNKSIDYILKLLDCGIVNYIVKSSDEQELIEAFNATMNSRKYLSSKILDDLLHQKKATRRTISARGHLTPSETEIVKLISQGFTTKKIALQKRLSIHTIISHRKNIFRKLEINNTSELIMHAMKTGIVDSTEYYI